MDLTTSRQVRNHGILGDYTFDSLRFDNWSSTRLYASVRLLRATPVLSGSDAVTEPATEEQLAKR